MVKSELGYLIFKLVFDIIVENVFYIIVEREIVMKSEGIYYFFYDFRFSISYYSY